MRFSLLSLVGLITLVPVEIFMLKTPSSTKLVIVSYAIYGLVLISTWGAFCLSGRLREFCKGFAVLAWGTVLYGSFFVNTDAFLETPMSPLAKYVARLFEHPIPLEDNVFDPRNRLREEWNFFKIWNQLNIVNFGILGGFLAMQIRTPIIGAPTQAMTDAPQGSLKPESPDFIS